MLLPNVIEEKFSVQKVYAARLLPNFRRQGFELKLRDDLDA